MGRASLIGFTMVAGSLLAACGGGGNGTTPGICLGANCAIVTTSRYNMDFTGVGTINTVELPTNKTTLGLDATIDPDVEIVTRDKQAMILNRSTGTVRLYDVSTWHVIAEVSTGDTAHPAAMSYPQGIAWLPGGLQAYVSLAGNDGAHAIGLVDLAQPDKGVIRYVSITVDAADTDGLPEAGPLYSCNGKVYALLQSYTFDATTFAVTYHPARIAEIDPASDASAAKYTTLTGLNPYGITATSAGCDKVLVATSGNLTTAPDGTAGIEAVDLKAGTSAGLLLTDVQIAGRPTFIAEVSPTLAFVSEWTDLAPNSMGMIFLSSAKVIAINPKTKTVIGDISKKAGNIAFMKVSPDNQLFVGTGLYSGMVEAGKLNKGLYIGKADGTGLGEATIDLGDTPSAIAFE